MLKKMFTSMVLLAATLPCFADGENKALSAEKALEALSAGNKRYVEFKMQHPHQDAKRLLETSKGQNPIAVIVACADSRVTPEIVFDQGIGDLFVIRTAGNLLGNNEIASIEYALAHLNTKLVVIVGHTECGAVKAIVGNAELTNHLAKALVGIKAAHKQVLKNPNGDLVDKTMRTHIQNEAATLKATKPVVKDKFENGDVKIISAVYDIKTGKVEFLN